MSEQSERVSAVQDYLQLISRISGINCFYMTEELEIYGQSSNSTPPQLINNQFIGLFHDEILPNLSAGQCCHYLTETGLHMLVTKLPDNDGYAIIGPYRRHRPSRAETGSYAKKLQLTREDEESLYSYFSSCVSNVIDMDILDYIYRHIYQTEPDIQYDSVVWEPSDMDEVSWMEEVNADQVDMQERYEQEQELKALVAQGKFTDALRILKGIRRISYSEIPAVNSLIRVINCNTLYKQALTEAGLPAVVIEQIYASYIRDVSAHPEKIEYAESDMEIKMLSDYCTLARENFTRHVSRLTHKVMDYVMLHYKEKLSVQDIAEKMNLSPNYLSSLFKRETGSSLSSYINQMRINGSLPLLANTSLSIAQVAEKVGIDDYNYFSRIFRRQMQISPSAYRSDYQKLAGQMYQGMQKMSGEEEAQ